MTTNGILLCNGMRYEDDIKLTNIDGLCFHCKNLYESTLGASTDEGLFVYCRCKVREQPSDEFTMPWHCKKYDVDMNKCKVNYL